MASRGLGRGWLVAASVLLVAAGAFAIVNYVSLRDARAERDQAVAALEAAGDRSDAARFEHTEAIRLEDEASTSVLEERQQLSAAESDAGEVSAALSEILAIGAAAAENEPTFLETALTYPDLAATVINAGESYLATGRELADLLNGQIESVGDGDYRTYNQLREQYNRLIETHNQNADSIAAAMSALPEFSFAGVSSGGAHPGAPVHLSDLDVQLAPPTGPARLSGSLPRSIPCSHEGEGCRWNWEITFEESNALSVRIQQLGIRYTDLQGSVWVSQSGEWRTVDIIVEPLGTVTWDTWVRDTNPDSGGNFQGATLQVRWEGIDADGNSITGRATAKLERRQDD